jgi:hypothetical protein
MWTPASLLHCRSKAEGAAPGCGANAVALGDEIEVERGAIALALSTGEVELERGAAAVMVGAKAEVEDGFVGLLLSGRTIVGEGGRVLLGTWSAFAMGVGFGLAFVLGRAFVRGRRS